MSSTTIQDKHTKLLTKQYFNQGAFSPYVQQRGQCDCACALISTHSQNAVIPATLVTPLLKNTESQTGVLADKTYPLPQTHLITTPLSAWLHITDRCNLRCAYCYLPHKSTDMSLTTGRAALDAIFRSALAHNYKSVKIKYSGGEPLLRFPVVLELHSYAQALANQHNIDLDGVILSNGTLLTTKIVKQINYLGLRLMVSLDGIGIYHDCQRSYANGQGSFKEAAHGVEVALSRGLTPNISITVSERNAQGLPAIVYWLLKRDVPFSLNFYRENPCSISQPDLQLEENHIIEGMLAAYKVIAEHLPNRSLLTSLADHTNLAIPHSHTCNVGQSYLVFDTQGQIHKCQMDLDNPITDCQDSDPLMTLQNDKISLPNPSVDQKIECQDCEWRYWCGGGCPLQTYRTKGSYNAKSPNCSIYKALFPEIVYLENQRLLKYNFVNHRNIAD